MAEFELTAQNVHYKERLLENYRTLEDPYQREIDELNYE
jgi:hypothetical protein